MTRPTLSCLRAPAWWPPRASAARAGAPRCAACARARRRRPTPRPCRHRVRVRGRRPPVSALRTSCMPGHCAGLQEGSRGRCFLVYHPLIAARYSAFLQSCRARPAGSTTSSRRAAAPGRALQACQRGHARKALHEAVDLGRGRRPERRPAPQRREALCSRACSAWSGAGQRGRARSRLRIG
jgi:hypothetical protein